MRLTHKIKENSYSVELNNPKTESEAKKQLMENFTKCCNKLGKLEDLEEQSRLIVLPCSIGDTIYEVCYKHKCDICENNNGNCGLRGGNAECVENIVEILERKFDLAYYSIYSQKLRKSYYLTREEAERRLEELSK